MDALAQKLLLQAQETTRFISTLQSIWAGESWWDVEPYAERAWRHFTRNDRHHCCWSEVRDFVREIWMQRQKS